MKQAGTSCISGDFMTDDLQHIHSWIHMNVYDTVTVTVIAAGLLQRVTLICLHFTSSALRFFFFFFFFCDVRFRSPACWRSAEVPLTEQTLSVHAAARMWREIKAGRLEIKDGALTDTEHVEFCFSASGVSSLSFLNTFYKKRSLLARCFNSRLTS